MSTESSPQRDIFERLPDELIKHIASYQTRAERKKTRIARRIPPAKWFSQMDERFDDLYKAISRIDDAYRQLEREDPYTFRSKRQYNNIDLKDDAKRLYHLIGSGTERSAAMKNATAVERGKMVVDDVLDYYNFTTLKEYIEYIYKYDDWLGNTNAVLEESDDEEEGQGQNFTTDEKRKAEYIWYMFQLALKTYKSVSVTAEDLQRIIELYTSWVTVFKEGYKRTSRQVVDDTTIRKAVRQNLTRIGVGLPAEGGRSRPRIARVQQARNKRSKAP